jgi:ankyrin repeat protein
VSGARRELIHAVERALAADDAAGLRDVFDEHPQARELVDAPLCPFDTPLLVHVASREDTGLLEVLLEAGADPNRRSEWWAGGFHALHSASPAAAARLLDAGAEADACAAAHLDRPDLLRTLLDEDPERVRERGGDGQTPLHFARSRRVADLLLERGADIDARDLDHRSTPAQWMLAGRRGAGRYELAAYLVERGASGDVFLAAALGLADRLRDLLADSPGLARKRTGRREYGEKPPSSFHIYTWSLGQYLSPLQVAERFGQDAAAAVLREVASEAELFLAACAAVREPEARSLLEARPGLLGELDAEAMRALPDAAWAGDAAAVALMLSLGFDPAARGQDGGTALHCAAWQGAVDCVEAALGHPGARALIEDRDPSHGSTPLGWCCHGARHSGHRRGDYPAVARLLLAAGARPGPNLEDAPEDVRAVIELQAPGT